MKTTKPCKICKKEMPKGLLNVCSRKCEEEKQKRKRAKVREKFGTTAKVSTLKERADGVFSDFIRNRDHYICVTCGLPGDKSNIDNGHYIPRAVLSLRYDETNCHAQCKKCNGRHNIDREPYRAYIMDIYGKKHLEWLSEKSKELSKGSKQFFIDIINQYKIGGNEGK